MHCEWVHVFVLSALGDNGTVISEISFHPKDDGSAVHDNSSALA